ncbi:MAG: acetate--CoA ligase [Pseudomonadota bacterium]
MDIQQYKNAYKKSIEDPQTFWQEQALQNLHWFTTFSEVKRGGNFKELLNNNSETTAEWFVGGELNISYNCIDRHLSTRHSQVAIIWEGDELNDIRTFTYQQVHDEVCRLANALRAQGVSKGDRVCIYLPMIPEAAFSMLACARIGAIHSVVFAGFSPQALSQRIQDAEAKCVITSDGGRRGGKSLPIKASVDEALMHCNSVKRVFVVQHTKQKIEWNARDVWYHQITAHEPPNAELEIQQAEDPLFILYTSGSTGKPKGVLHTTAGYLLNASLTHRILLDHREGDIYWCTADIGWITGHSYVVYGPLANGGTTLMYEGVPTHPNASRWWEMIDRHRVTTFYTAPTAIRALMAQGEHYLKNSHRKSLRLLGTVGEPINPEAWRWYHENVGKKRCAIVDTWWQTETGAIMISPHPQNQTLLHFETAKPGAAQQPFFGIEPVLLNTDGKEIHGAGEGLLAIKNTWPSQLRTLYKDHERCLKTYFAPYPGYYFTGDGARRDAEGDYWITGRVDDVLNISGHRLGTAELESALVLHPAVAEAAVVGIPHDIKGQGICAYVCLMEGQTFTDQLRQELIQWVAKQVGPIAKPDQLHCAKALPKTRSGKIMRRILRVIAEGRINELGDTSTLADPSVVESLIEGMKK